MHSINIFKSQILKRFKMVKNDKCKSVTLISYDSAVFRGIYVN